MEMEPEVLEGPMPPQTGGAMYSVTLPSGMIVTNPSGFGTAEIETSFEAIIVTEDGRVLVPRNRERRDDTAPPS
jgi:hypothetical protein